MDFTPTAHLSLDSSHVRCSVATHCQHRSRNIDEGRTYNEHHQRKQQVCSASPDGASFILAYSYFLWAPVTHSTYHLTPS